MRKVALAPSPNKSNHSSGRLGTSGPTKNGLTISMVFHWSTMDREESMEEIWSEIVRALDP